MLDTIDDVKAKINALYQAGLNFDKAKARLEKLKPVAAQNPQTLARYNDIMNRGGGLKSTISTAITKIQDVYNWVKSTLGINLGVLPIVPVALLSGIVAATAAAVAWINEANTEAKKLEIIATLPVEQRAAALANPQTITGNISKTAMWIALGLAAVFVLPKLLDKR